MPARGPLLARAPLRSLSPVFDAYRRGKPVSMGVTFSMEAVKVDEGERLLRLEGPSASFSISSYDLFDLLERIETRMRKPLATLFPWYAHARSSHLDAEPQPSDCFRPKEVLGSIQAIERELQKHSAKYPCAWAFLVPEADGTRGRHLELRAYYREKPCRLFGDAKGCWAVETDTPLAYPVHYELTAVAQVVVRLAVDGPEVTVGIERTSCLGAHAKMLSGMKKVCLFAMENGGLLSTSAG
jgi:hypothetical protein